MTDPYDDEQPLAPADSLSILLADDNVVEQKIAARMFLDLGYTIDVVSNGFEVVQALRFKPYDVVLIDEDMPEMDAIETATRIRKLPALEKQPWIISLAVDVDQTLTDEYRIAGVNDLLNKPLNEVVLWAALGRVSSVMSEKDKSLT